MTEKIRLLRALRVTALFLLLLFFSVRAAPAEEIKTITSTGYASLAAGTAVSRDRAVEDALRKAVEQAVGAVVSSETVVENYQVLRDNIYTRTRGYIKGYRIVSEGPEGGLYRVTLKVDVSLGDIKKDLDAMGLAYARAGLPRVLFMIAERGIDSDSYSYWWDRVQGPRSNLAGQALKEIFIERGFNVVEAPFTGREIFIPDTLRTEDLTAPEAGRIGEILGAEIVVKGRAIIEKGPQRAGRPVKLYTADISVEALGADTGSVLAAASGHGTSRNTSDVAGANEALRKAAEGAAQKLISQITARWKGPHLVTVRLYSVPDYRSVTAFKEKLRTIRGTRAVFQRSFSGESAVFQILTRLPAKDIADEVSRFRMPALRVIRTTPSTIEAVVAKPGG